MWVALAVAAATVGLASASCGAGNGQAGSSLAGALNSAGSGLSTGGASLSSGWTVVSQTGDTAMLERSGQVIQIAVDEFGTLHESPTRPSEGR
jgi:hypothetical protein